MNLQTQMNFQMQMIYIMSKKVHLIDPWNLLKWPLHFQPNPTPNQTAIDHVRSRLFHTSMVFTIYNLFVFFFFKEMTAAPPNRITTRKYQHVDRLTDKLSRNIERFVQGELSLPTQEMSFILNCQVCENSKLTITRRSRSSHKWENGRKRRDEDYVVQKL
jgi:hypothetical protein